MTPQYQILKTYKSLTSAFRNWKRNKGEQIGSIEEYRGFILESNGEPNETELFLLDFKLNGFVSYGVLATKESARERVDNWIKEQAHEMIASEVD